MAVAKALAVETESWRPWGVARRSRIATAICTAGDGEPGGGGAVGGEGGRER